MSKIEKPYRKKRFGKLRYGDVVVPADTEAASDDCDLLRRRGVVFRSRSLHVVFEHRASTGTCESSQGFRQRASQETP